MWSSRVHGRDSFIIILYAFNYPPVPRRGGQTARCAFFFLNLKSHATVAAPSSYNINIAAVHLPSGRDPSAASKASASQGSGFRSAAH
jgi:hypothetical protein